MTVIEAHAKAEFVFANRNLKRLVDLIMLQTLHKRAPNNYTKLFIKGLKRLRENSWEMMSDAEAGEGEPDDE
jgi:hypothetical protein